MTVVDPFNAPLRTAPDLSVPENLIAKLEVLARGLEQQAVVFQSGSAMGGIPDPSYFYGECARCILLGVKLLKEAYLPVVPEPKPADSKPKEVPPSSGGKTHDKK